SLENQAVSGAPETTMPSESVNVQLNVGRLLPHVLMISDVDPFRVGPFQLAVHHAPGAGLGELSRSTRSRTTNRPANAPPSYSAITSCNASSSGFELAPSPEGSVTTT